MATNISDFVAESNQQVSSYMHKQNIKIKSISMF